MNFLALLLGLAVERVLTHLFHLREFRWLDPLFDAHLRRFSHARPWAALALTATMISLLVLPVALLALALWDELLQIPYFLLAVLVLLFSLGPRDLDDEVEDYCDALETGDADTRQRVAEQLLEHPPAGSPAEQNDAVERAIYVQANNRIFGVVFWFLLLGPTGAWAFRVLDLLRRRAVVQADASSSHRWAAFTLHGVFAWLPSRLLALGYVLAGNFEEAMAVWRHAGREAAASFVDNIREILATVGIAAAGRAALDVADPMEALDRIRAARSLVMRALWMIWCPVIAVLTLYDWLT